MKKASLAPIIVALLLLVSVGLFGLVISTWPTERAAAPPKPQGETEQGNSRAYEGGFVVPPPLKMRRSRWI